MTLDETVLSLSVLCERFWQTFNLKGTIVIKFYENSWKAGDFDAKLLAEILKLWNTNANSRDDAQVLVKVVALISSKEYFLDYDLENICFRSLTEWTSLLRPFFEESKSSPVPPSILVRDQLSPKESERIAIWDNECSWRLESRVSIAFLSCISLLPTKSVTRLDQASKLIPFVIHISEDYDPVNRLLGVKAIKSFLWAVPDKLVTQMQLDSLFRQTLVKNLSYDNLNLKRESLHVLLDNILTNNTLDMERKLEWGEDLLTMTIKDAMLTKEVDTLTMYLEALPQIIKLMGVAIVCHLKSVLAFILDCAEDTRIAQLASLGISLDVLFDYGWPRISSHLPIIQQIITRLQRIDRQDQEMLLQLSERLAHLK